MNHEFLAFYLLLWLIPLILYALLLRYRMSKEERQAVVDVIKAAGAVARALPPELARQAEVLAEVINRAGITMDEAAANLHFGKVADLMLHGEQPPTYLLDGSLVIDAPAVEYPDGTALDLYGRLMIDYAELPGCELVEPEPLSSNMSMK